MKYPFKPRFGNIITQDIYELDENRSSSSRRFKKIKRVTRSETIPNQVCRPNEVHAALEEPKEPEVPGDLSQADLIDNNSSASSHASSHNDEEMWYDIEYGMPEEEMLERMNELRIGDANDAPEVLILAQQTAEPQINWADPKAANEGREKLFVERENWIRQFPEIINEFVKTENQIPRCAMVGCAETAQWKCLDCDRGDPFQTFALLRI